MNILDIILGLLLLTGLFKGFKNGLILELASLFGLVAGIYGAIHFSYIAGNYISQYIHLDQKHINLASFLITLVLIVIIIHFAAKLLTQIINIILLGLLNKIAGAVFGTLRVAVLLGAILVFIDSINFSFPFDFIDKGGSKLYEPIKEIGSFIFGNFIKENNILHNIHLPTSVRIR